MKHIRTITYKITHEFGIQQVGFNYHAEGMEVGEVNMVTVVERFRNCPQSVTVTVEKMEPLKGDNELGLLSQLVIESCSSQILAWGAWGSSMGGKSRLNIFF